MLKVLIFKLSDHAATLAVFFCFFFLTSLLLNYQWMTKAKIPYHFTLYLKKQLDHLTPTPYHSCLSFTFKNTAAKALFLTKWLNVSFPRKSCLVMGCLGLLVKPINTYGAHFNGLHDSFLLFFPHPKLFGSHPKLYQTA